MTLDDLQTQFVALETQRSAIWEALKNCRARDQCTWADQGFPSIEIIDKISEFNRQLNEITLQIDVVIQNLRALR